MARHKLSRFQYNAASENVVERGKEFYTTIKGKWRESFFKNDNPIVLELACGKGEYTTGLAKEFPNKNFIGIDIKGDRIARGSKRAIDMGLTNVAFLRTSMAYLEEFFEENEVNEIWLIHPDPQPRDKEERKRLTNNRYLSLYKKILKNEGDFYFKTDNFPLFEYSLVTIPAAGFEIQRQTIDLYNSPFLAEHYGIETHYERLFVAKGYKINYLVAKNIK
ncbi:tRNA (guanine-N(7)-)-methyltransferase [Emticicia oligotrophica DSM 17448]|uniref:tRNA (guanine-N(7)-)-methyltransferase n=1 Tax=Emticicia oligotrophica (strain DSM 17448 / CIP 109782 / MTCC 6937 / GPTSA100-15) TaxID=929562 RepID=A0ABM5N772_EMTOG|nr:tRNA (guanosine(46)-N7)-methyltransferase TrmB [Emticicia oligotrophica]AFK05323.1 tRNA (guanine-N(7)-)-methyltransferase [Emticicia oligotrophica DSM 17448]